MILGTPIGSTALADRQRSLAGIIFIREVQQWQEAAVRTFTLKETFNAAGYDNTGWTANPGTGGTIDPDDTTAPIMEGVQQLKIFAGIVTQKSYIDRTMTAMTEVWG